jgi:hypothetical protein
MTREAAQSAARALLDAMAGTTPKGCSYTAPTFGANYPDGVCVEGYLWDADSGDSDGDGWVYTSGGEIPCPFCNRGAAIEACAEEMAFDSPNERHRSHHFRKRAEKRIDTHLHDMQLRYGPFRR